MQEQSLFIAALEKENPAERAAFLDQACAGNPALRQRIDRLLQRHQETDSLLDSPAVVLGSPGKEPSQERPGTVIGPYKLLEQIGEGGFGIVYLAEQQEPVRRTVALKVIKPGMDSKQVIARFEAERQALALMDHPSIAKVLDAGATETGRPYFIMELVRGVPITQFCDDHQLTPRQRLELFVAVCQAVQHAHQKGIIHRDLKPSNVLITLQDGTPRVKVIDFGIAKALGQERLTDKTLFTGFAQMIGTPLYMSPEQAEMSGQDADTRTDIYALGVLLYELLTGTTPFDKERLKEAGYDEIRRIIREEEPAKPSTRLSTLGQAASTVSANRKSEPRRLSQLFRGELDWIVMKALEKDRNRRYESASSFAADVQRFLKDEPVQACPPSAIYRFRKFARRNKGGLITATAVALAVLLAVAGLATSTVLTLQAKHELQQTLQRERQNSYFQRIALAERGWAANNMTRVDQLLADCPVELRGWEWNYLHRLGHRSSPLLHHSSAALCVAFSPDGRRLASGALDGTVKIWDTQSWSERHFRAHERHVRGVAFSPDSRRLATTSWDGTAKVWDVESGRLLFPLRAEPGRRYQHVAFSPDGRWIASGGYNKDHAILVWDALTGNIHHTLRGHQDRIVSVAFGSDGRWLASASFDHTVRLWDPLTGREIRRFAGPNDYDLNSVALSPDGRRLAAAGGRNLSGQITAILVWDTATGEEVSRLLGHTMAVFCLHFSPDGRRLASGSEDRTVKIWDVRTGKEALTLHGHQDAVFDLTFSPDGYRLASAGAEGQVRIWDATPVEDYAGEELLTLRGHTKQVYCLAFSPDGNRLATGSEDQTVQTWDPATGERLQCLRFASPVHGLSYSPDRRWLAVVGRDKKLTLCDAQTGEKRFDFPGEAGNQCAVFSPDSRRIATGGVGDFRVKTWDPATRRRCLALPGHEWVVHGLAIHPSGRLLASGSFDKAVKVWDVAPNQELRPLFACGASILSSLVSLQLAEVPFVRTLIGHTAGVRGVAFSPDGERLASGGLDGTVRCWNTRTWKETLILHDPTGGTVAVAFSPDGRQLATGGTDATVKVWDALTGELIRALHGHTHWVYAVGFSPDGKRIASASLDGTVRIWKAPPLPKASARPPAVT